MGGHRSLWSVLVAEAIKPAVTVEELVAAGLYDPEAGNSAERLAALQLLVERGATKEDLLGSRETSAWSRSGCCAFRLGTG